LLPSVFIFDETGAPTEILLKTSSQIQSSGNKKGAKYNEKDYTKVSSH
jgi:hypothetical protein